MRLEFTDNTTQEMDLEPYLHGSIFEPIRNDLRMFRAVQADRHMGTIVWENGADIDPDVLYKGLTPAWMEAASTMGYPVAVFGIGAMWYSRAKTSHSHIVEWN